jgi:leucyl aminopeptidase
MRWTASKGDLAGQAGDLIIRPVLRGDDGADLGGLQGHDGLGDLIAKAGFTGAAGTTLPVHCPGMKAPWFLLVGLGREDELSLDGLRRAAGTAAQTARRMGARTVILQPTRAATGFDTTTVVRCWVEGAELALSPAGPADAKRTAKDGPVHWKVLPMPVDVAADVRRGLAEGQAAVAGSLEARRLVNLPPNDLTPALLARAARAIARRGDFKCTVLGVAELRKRGMGGLLGVGQGSVNPPCLICLESRSAPKDAPTVALVGKGVTFDSGGISLKPGPKMDVMKSDMAGAAAVLGAAEIIAARKLPVRLLAVVPTAENMPDGNAIKPADVLSMANGLTVEVLNTDAEGRLILADALHYAAGRKPDYIIDMATLTGACAVALGDQFAGVMGTSGELMDVLEQAGGETGERVWPLPLVDAHREAIKSKVADIKNIGQREGGALTAGAFLSYFVPDSVAWAHVDIAGPAWTDTGGALGPRGGTGFGARLLARAVEILVG